ncbi:MAG: tetratricopeptide repeat protein [Acidobacteriota bacterium]
MQKDLKIVNALMDTPPVKDASGQMRPNPLLPIKQQISRILAMLPSIKMAGQADDEMVKKNYEQAINLYRDALKQNASDPGTYYKLAVAYASANQIDAARQAIDKALELKKDEQTFLDLKKQLDQPAAQARVNEALMQADAAYNTKDYSGALKKYEEALPMLQEPKKQAVIWNQIGNVCVRLGQTDEAVQAYNHAIELDPSNADIYRQNSVLTQADAAYNTKDYSGALKKYEEALPMLREPKKQAVIWDQIGNARTELGQTDEAVQAYKNAMALDPSRGASYNQDLTRHYQIVGQQLLNKKMYDQAFAYLAEGGFSLFKLGHDWAQKDETADFAIAAFQKMIKTDPQNTEAYYELGMVYWQRKKDAKLARGYLSRYVEMGKNQTFLSQAKDIIAIIDTKK